MNKIEQIIPPAELQELLPSSEIQRNFIFETRTAINKILSGKDDRLILVVGPCSIHDINAAKEYAYRLSLLSRQVEDRFLIIMRVYLEKPRSIFGWKGLIHDPYLDGSYDLMTGLKWSRQLLLELASMKVAAGTEFLEFITPSYIADLVSWGSIGARTCTSQPHRQLASSLPMPVGIKNALDGNVANAIGGVLSAAVPQACISIGPNGYASLLKTSGNPFGHLILRGSSHRSNYDNQSIKEASILLHEAGLSPTLIVDCSHGNSQKNYSAQEAVFEYLIEQVISGNKNIIGMMLESHLNEGSQTHPGELSQLQYGVSLTDPCINWKTTEKLILSAHRSLANLKESNQPTPAAANIEADYCQNKSPLYM
jgi:3-deoxy-7-phosphoheptulonate synthase